MAATTERVSAVRIRTGVTMHYVESGPAEAPEVVVLLHGWPDSAFSFSRVTPALAAAGHRTLAVDQRGFGDSSRPSTGYRIDDFAEDAVAFLDALDLPAVTLVGHSMGTFVARRATQLHPDRVRRLVLIGTAATAANEVVREVVELVADLPDPVPVEFAREFQAGTLHHPVPEPFFDRIVAESVKAPARVWRGVVDDLLIHDDLPLLADIGVPTIVLGGEQDALFPPAEQAAVASAIPRARLVLYPDTGHCPNWERPEQVAGDIDAFIRET
jgi:pimeloyl-ACP methyl ester carboxylesterase